MIKNILIGDVWLASGQSNMAMVLGKGAKEAIAEPEATNLRFFNVSTELENKEGPLERFGSWLQLKQDQDKCSWLFLCCRTEELGIPIGLINCSYGGTVTETWCSPEVLNMGFLFGKNEKNGY